jgi:putative flippase GtrA
MPLTTTAQSAAGTGGLESTAPVLDVVIPVYNEETDIERCVRRLHDHLALSFPYPFAITIADNASTDRTLEIARDLARELRHVRVIHLAEKGRGRALRIAWTESQAAVLAYMDVDLSTDLAALLPLVAPLISGHSDLAIGSRLARGSRVVRGLKREAISRSYNLLLRGTLAIRFTDAQCGFKAIRADVARQLVPLVRDTGWFFDTELLVLAERAGLRIHEVPVDWVDDPDSRVDLVATALADMRGIARLGRALATEALPLADIRARLGRLPLRTPDDAGLRHQAARFTVVGVTSTLVYLALYCGLRLMMPPIAANVIALFTTAVGNTLANRRLTFGVVGRQHAVRHLGLGLAVFALGLGLTTGALAAIHTVTPNPPTAWELAALVTANLLATVARFVLLRYWMHHRRADGTGGPANRGRRRPTGERRLDLEHAVQESAVALHDHP